MADQPREPGTPAKSGVPAEGPSRPGPAEASREKTTSAEERIAELEGALQAKTAEVAAFQDRYLRELAESENFKKRQLRDKTDAVRFANESILRDIIPVIDNLELALAHADLGGNGQSVVEGVEMVLRLFRDVLERQGVKEIADPVGTPLDPSTQEATGVERMEGVAPNTVLRQLQKGYRYNERLLRPARVIVCSGSPSEDESVH